MSEQPKDELQKFIDEWLSYLSKDHKTIPDDILGRIQRETIETGLIGLNHDPDSEFDDKAGVILEIIRSSRSMTNTMRDAFFQALKDDIDLVPRVQSTSTQDSHSQVVSNNDIDIVDIPGVVDHSASGAPDIEELYDAESPEANTAEDFDDQV